MNGMTRFSFGMLTILEEETRLTSRCNRSL